MTTIALYLDSDDALLRSCADKAIASAKKYMTDAEVVVLAEHMPEKPFTYRRTHAHSRITGDCIFIDCDVMFYADVRDVFKYDFDVAVVTDTRPGSPKVRFDGGVTFSRNPRVWEELRDHIGHLTFREKPGDWQPIMEAQTEFFEQRRFKTLVLPGEIYCAVPDTEGEHVNGAKIMHYRGYRKGWMR